MLNVYFLPASFSLSDEMRKQSLGVFGLPAGGTQQPDTFLQFSQRRLTASPRSPSSSETQSGCISTFEISALFLSSENLEGLCSCYCIVLEQLHNRN